ncbi:MAG: rhodanese-like domain-containing protein [Anaerolineales bacterium]|nr:rhodanese-like domain-containing protein [Anaerolineales bacterium]
MKKQKHLFLLLLLLLLAACSSNTATVDPADIDVASLPADIDVQTVNAIKDRDDVFVIDVREQWEYDESHIPNITLMPMGEIASRLSEIPTDKEVVVTCRSGNRSSQVATFLRDQGFTNIHNMEGGILAWQQAGLPVE